MAKRFYKYFPWLFIFGELAILYGSLILTDAVVSYFFSIPAIGINHHYIILFFWICVITFRKDYKLGRTSSYENTLKNLFESVFWFVLLILMWWILFIHIPNSSRIYPILLTGTIMLFIGFYRIMVHKALREYRASGRNYRNAVIIGKNLLSSQLADLFYRRKEFGINFLGFFDDLVTEKDFLGKFQEFFEKAETLELDLIYLSENLEHSLIKKIIHFGDENYIKVKIIPGNNLQLEKKLSFSRYGDFLVVNLNDIPLDNLFNRVIKRSFDILFSLFVLIFILSWLAPLIGLLIKIETGGPVFFVQKRNGTNNRIFKCFKFRSMVPNEFEDTKQAEKNDPRITRIGALIRKFSIDEMPQFLNVLFGEMSIVGPRPHTVPMNQLYKSQLEKYNSRHKIKPGITGLAQVLGYRGEIENPYQIRSRVKLDYFYIENWSFWLDVTIVIRTVGEIINNRQNVY